MAKSEEYSQPVGNRAEQDELDTAQWVGRGCDGVTERYVESHKPLRDEEDK